MVTRQLIGDSQVVSFHCYPDASAPGGADLCSCCDGCGLAPPAQRVKRAQSNYCSQQVYPLASASLR